MPSSWSPNTPTGVRDSVSIRSPDPLTLRVLSGGHPHIVCPRNDNETNSQPHVPRVRVSFLRIDPRTSKHISKSFMKVRNVINTRILYSHLLSDTTLRLQYQLSIRIVHLRYRYNLTPFVTFFLFHPARYIPLTLIISYPHQMFKFPPQVFHPE